MRFLPCSLAALGIFTRLHLSFPVLADVRQLELERKMILKEPLTLLAG